MDTTKYMIIDNESNTFITADVQTYSHDQETHMHHITFKSGKTYSYNARRITYLENPQVLDPSFYRITHLEIKFDNIVAIYVFSDSKQQYWHICFYNRTEHDYFERDLTIVKSCLADKVSKNVFSYLNHISTLINVEAADGTIYHLATQYERIAPFIGQDTALAAYLCPHSDEAISHATATPIFPFGCNASQFKAVKAALEHQISVIQGPPGTGKTQTILNIIANLLVLGKTVQVVSSNNSAVEHVLEKLAETDYGMDFLAALLGNSTNKKAFLRKQTGRYPDLSQWNQEIPEDSQFCDKISRYSRTLLHIFKQKEQLALLNHELQTLRIEQQHFAQYTEEKHGNLTNHTIRNMPKSQKLMQLWQQCQAFLDKGRKVSFLFRIKSCIIYGIADWEFYHYDVSEIINMFQALYYQARDQELTTEIEKLEHELSLQDADSLSEEFKKLSLVYLKRILYDRYGSKSGRPIFVEDDLWQKSREFQAEYPIILSTAFSSRSSLHKGASFDYVIMDEASQVDVATGALALSSAKNAVIVGDTKQLSNIVRPNLKKQADAIFDSYQLAESYRLTKNFLQSVCELFPDAPQTLLREHYRCHPKIINFCNQKFYDGNLIIMTPDNGEKDVITVKKTPAGNHERDHMNQRQIDSISKEILPDLPFPHTDIGIITPYRNQVEALRTEIQGNDLEIATVHKFQGREKDVIILSTVDNEITAFIDDPHLMNVAISRAKKHLRLVMSGNEQSKNSNFLDFVSYIEYHDFQIETSNIYSVFDYLYKQYTQSRIALLKKHKRISKYDSENLMYILITDTLQEIGLSYINVTCHQSLNMLIRNPNLLNDREYQYAKNPATHLDFLIYNCVSKKPILAIEVDGYRFHKKGTKQAERDNMKNHILDLYQIPYLRFATNGSGEKEILTKKLHELLKQ